MPYRLATSPKNGGTINKAPPFDKQKNMTPTPKAPVRGPGADLRALEARLGHRFRDPALLVRALTHSSWAYEHPGLGDDNETLEFLGDSVLELTLAELLLERFPELREGVLSRIRAGLVNETWLADMARNLRLGEHLLLGRGEERSGGRTKPSILSSAFEAVTGAIHLDGGHAASQSFVRRRFAPHLDAPETTLALLDPKTALQELLQGRAGEAPSYELLHAEGPSHARTFTVAARFRGEELGRGQAHNKKTAEQRAARAAIRKMRGKNLDDWANNFLE